MVCLTLDIIIFVIVTRLLITLGFITLISNSFKEDGRLGYLGCGLLK